MRFIDFFSGIGGFRLGMEMAGHECAGHCEIDKFANISYAAIHQPKEGEWFADDIRAVRPEELPNVDCYCGGFPCQSFSIAGKRGGFDDTRGTLFFEVMRLAEIRKPRLLFLENVEGLVNHNKGFTFETMLRTMDELGYDAEWQMFNSKNFEVPQNRERVFIIGHLRGKRAGEVFPFPGTDGEADAQLSELTRDTADAQRVYDGNGIARTLKGESGGQGGKTGLYLIGKDGHEKQKDCASCLTGGGHSGGNHSDMDLLFQPYNADGNGNAYCLDANYFKGITANQDRTGVAVQPVLTPERAEKRQNGRWFKDDGEEMFTLTAQDRHGVAISCINGGALQSDRVYDADGIAPTIRRGSENSGTVTPQIMQNTRIRRPTPRECFRLQGFPDWAFDRAKAAGISDSQLYKQAGNSVTVNVIYEIAKRLG